MEVFWDKGYGAATPNELVEALGIGKGSLYHAFGSKRRLFELALRHYRDTRAARLIEVLGQPGPVKARLSDALTAIVEMGLASPARRGCLAVNTAAELAGADEEAVGLVREMFDRTERAFASLIEEGKRSGEIDPDRNSEDLASLLLNTVIGLQIGTMVASGPARLDAAVRAIVDLL
jgi:TetR/AcrR family transcriptional repressor of nem operon